MSPRIVTGGGMRIDYLVTHDGRSQAGLVGGNALYAAVGAALWSTQVGLWARIGANYPQAWMAQLEQLHLKTAGLHRVAGEQDHRTFYAYLPDGRRDDTDPAAHFARVGLPLPADLIDYVHSTPGQDDPETYEPLALRPTDWPAAYGQAEAVHLAPLSIRTHCQVPARLRSDGVALITIDPGERYMRPGLDTIIRQFLPQVDAFLPSDQEVRSLLGDGVDLRQAARTFAAWGVPLVIVKCGSDGALLCRGPDDSCQLLPAYHRPGDPRVIDVTGAGDAFCGGFLAGLTLYDDPFTAACCGLVSASFVIEGYGALYALQNTTSAAVQDRLQELLSDQPAGS